MALLSPEETLKAIRAHQAANSASITPIEENGASCLDDLFSDLPTDAKSYPPPTATTFMDRVDVAIEVEAAFIPLNPRMKTPWCGLGVHSKTTDRAKAQEWNKNPNLNCGIVAVHQEGGLWFLDDDRGTLAKTIMKETRHDMSPFFRVRTSRGFHYYFEHDAASLAVRYDGNTNSGVIETPEYKGEARTDNQYVLSPLSVHPDGSIYTIENDTVIIPAPTWLLEWVQAKYVRGLELNPGKKKTPKALKSPQMYGVTRTEDGRLFIGKTPPDPGFGKLFEQVGYSPLVCRLNKHADPRYHDFSLGDGEPNTYCPIPSHCPPSGWDVSVSYTPCFGVIAGAPHLLHCFGCGWSGDMVAACNKLDGGQQTMYQTARDICSEENLQFEEFFPVEKTDTVAEAVQVLLSDDSKPKPELPVDENSEEAIPDFDPSVVNGIYKKFVELATRGTTLAPQFAYVIAKTVVGLRMAGRVKFENLDVQPRFYTALIGATGSGKGESFRRIENILTPDGSMSSCKVKIIHGADSGAGLTDAFFEVPEDQPLLCYTDEVETLGNKSKDTRNPGILDTMIELADSTSISRVLAKSRGGTKTKHDARFGMVMCGQSGDVYMKALAGRTKLGLWDRFTPEYSVPQETGDLPPIDAKDAIALLSEFNSLDYSGVMSMSAEAKTHLDDFWKWQPADVRKKARWKKNLQLDAYMSAFGYGRKIVEPEDVVIAIKIFTRQLVIRKVCFSVEVPDRVGYYLGLIKRITERMSKQLAVGVSPEVVAKSRRDFETETNAYRDNESHIFERAWNVHSPVWLAKVMVKKANGREYVKFVPRQEE